jgi:hypothetical protein
MGQNMTIQITKWKYHKMVITNSISTLKQARGELLSVTRQGTLGKKQQLATVMVQLMLNYDQITP